MLRIRIADLWSPKGTLPNKEYLFWGFLLFAIKYQADRFVATFIFHKKWRVWDYLIPPWQVEFMKNEDRAFLTALFLMALPFIWAGTVLTIRRLRDARLPLWLLLFFFVPILNLFLFAILILIPSREQRSVRVLSKAKRPSIGQFIPKNAAGSALLALIINVLSALLFTRFSVETLNQYGWGLFIGFPFCLGLTSSLIYSYHEERSWTNCVMVALLSIGMSGVALFLIAFEGAICILMAGPLLGVLALLGATLGYMIQFHPAGAEETPKIFCVAVLLVPALMTFQKLEPPPPQLFPVVTRIEIEAPQQTVWNHVVSFSELPQPEEWIFRTGLAYPVRAEIHGTGEGAVRHCLFSTGSFVEPITVWDEPERLQFSVIKNPAPMQEWTIYDELHPPHLEGFFVSRKGQFRLIRLSGSRTLLEGTTWYHHNLWPESYWRVWSDFIIHKIHLRVLRHIKRLSEQNL